MSLSSNPLLLSPIVTAVPLDDIFDFVTYLALARLRALELFLSFFTTVCKSSVTTKITIKNPTTAIVNIPPDMPFFFSFFFFLSSDFPGVEFSEKNKQDNRKSNYDCFCRNTYKMFSVTFGK